MSEMSADFEAYRALDPMMRMQARLEGLAEVLSASGMEILPGVSRATSAQGAAFNPARGQQQAFNEARADFEPAEPAERHGTPTSGAARAGRAPRAKE